MPLMLGLLAVVLSGMDAPPTGAPIERAEATGTGAKREAPEAWNLSLPEAIRIALDNAESIRMISLLGVPVNSCQCFQLRDPERIRKSLPVVKLPESPGGPAASETPVIIARISTDVDFQSFRAEAMTFVRSVERHYWDLARQDVEHRSRVSAYRAASEVVGRERARLAKGDVTSPALGDAEAMLEGFRLELATASSDLGQSERRLREVLGLRLADDRRLVPTTFPREDGNKPDWTDSLARMMEHRPDILREKKLVEMAQFRLLVARNLAPIEVLRFRNGKFLFRSPVLNQKQAQYQLRRQRESLDEVITVAACSLGPILLGIGPASGTCRAARDLADAAERLDVRRIAYEEGRDTGARYLDALSRWVQAVASEAQARADSSNALANLEEARGTLLDAANIAVYEGTKGRKRYIQRGETMGRATGQARE